MVSGIPETINWETIQSVKRLLDCSEIRPFTDDPYTTCSLVGYRVHGSREAMQAARRILDVAMEPATPAQLMRELARLRALTVTRSSGADDTTLALSALADVLMDFPGDAVLAALRQWPLKNKYWPAASEIVALVRNLAEERMMLVEALR